jgi:hypothetical protein
LKSLTLDDDWLVIPLPDVDETIVPVARVPAINTPDVVTVDVPPLSGNGQVSPVTTVDGVPLVVINEVMPVARPLKRSAVCIWALAWLKTAKTSVAVTQI